MSLRKLQTKSTNPLQGLQHDWCQRLTVASDRQIVFLSQPHSSQKTETAQHAGETSFPLLAEALSEWNSPKGSEPEPIIVVLAPHILPLRGFLSLIRPDNRSSFAITAPETGLPVALVGADTSLRALADSGGFASVPKKNLERRDIFAAPTRHTSWFFDPQDDWHLASDVLQQSKIIDLGDAKNAQEIPHLPLWYVETLNAPLGAFARTLAPRPAPFTKTLDYEPPSFTLDDIDVIAVTTDRRRSVAKLLASIREHLGSAVGITVVVQSKKTLAWRLLARRHRAVCLHVPDDSGLSWSRNHAVHNTTRPLVFLMDDDFQLDERCRIHDALNILNRHPELSILGGNLLDVETWKDGKEREVSQGFAMTMVESEPELVWLRLEDRPRERVFVNPTDYIEYADIVDNFALIKRADVFDQGVFWNPALKIGAEHQDFYIRLKRLKTATVARTNALKVRNVRVQSRRFRKMRSRVDRFFEIFFNDLGIKSFTIIGERQRVSAVDGGHAWAENRNLIPHCIPRRGKS